MSDNLKSRPGGHGHPCEGRKRNGKQCGAINTLRTLDGGYRCRHHRTGLTVASTGDLDQPMPDTKFRTRADAERYTQWILQQGSRGHLNAAQVGAMMKVVSMWNHLQERLEKKLMKEFTALVKRANDEFERLTEIAERQEGND